MTALNLTPQDTNYLTSSLINQQLNQNKEILTVHSSDILFTPTVPATILLDGSGRGQFTGAVSIFANPVANMILCNLPGNLKISKDYFLPITVMRAGIYIPNVIHLNPNDFNTFNHLVVRLINAPLVGDFIYLDSALFLLNTYN